MSEDIRKMFDTPPAPPAPEPGGAMDSGMRALVRSLRLAFLALVVIILGAVVYFIGLGGYIVVPAQEEVIVLRFGTYMETCSRGPHWFMPYPVTSFVRIPVTPQTIRVDYLAVPAADGSTVPLLVPGVDHYNLTGDTNIVHTSWSFTYNITDPKRYYESCLTPVDPRLNDDMVPFGSTPPTGRGPQTLLKCLLNEAVTTVTAQMTIDDIIFNKRAEYRDRVYEIFVKSVADMNLGIAIDNLPPPGVVEPPLQTKEAFDLVNKISNSSDSYISEANSMAIKLVSDAQSEAAQTLADAESYKRRAVEELMSESDYFNSILAEYQKDSSSTLVSLYSDALGDALSSVHDKYVIGGVRGANKQLKLKLNPELIRKQPSAAAPQPQNHAAGQQ